MGDLCYSVNPFIGVKTELVVSTRLRRKGEGKDTKGAQQIDE